MAYWTVGSTSCRVTGTTRSSRAVTASATSAAGDSSPTSSPFISLCSACALCSVCLVCRGLVWSSGVVDVVQLAQQGAAGGRGHQRPAERLLLRRDATTDPRRRGGDLV